VKKGLAKLLGGVKLKLGKGAFEMSRKVKYSPEERLKIVLEGLQGEDSVAEVCRRYGIYPTEYYRYKQLALKGALEGLKANPLRKDREKERLEKEKEKLKRVIVELTLEN